MNARDESLLLENHELNDKHVCKCVTKMLLHQFPSFQGLESSLVQDNIEFWINNYIQIFHSCSCHWITVSTIGCQSDTINIYSLYRDIDGIIKQKTEKVFDSSIKFQLPKVQMQKGHTECGLFAIVFAIALAFGDNPEACKFDQSKMQSHLCACFEKHNISKFP